MSDMEQETNHFTSSLLSADQLTDISTIILKPICLMDQWFLQYQIMDQDK